MFVWNFAYIGNFPLGDTVFWNVCVTMTYANIINMLQIILFLRSATSNQYYLSDNAHKTADFIYFFTFQGNVF